MPIAFRFLSELLRESLVTHLGGVVLHDRCELKHPTLKIKVDFSLAINPISSGIVIKARLGRQDACAATI